MAQHFELYKKESEKKNALYMDAFTANGNDPQPIDLGYKDVQNELKAYKDKYPWQKSNKVARDSYDMANYLATEQKKIPEAIELYNRALCYAEPGTELGEEIIIFSYVNRSVSFVGLKNWDKSLIDIDLAIKSKYFEHKKASDRGKKNIKDQHKFCKQMINNGWKPDQMDFISHDQLPVLAHSVDIQFGENGSGRLGRMVAERDIDVGEYVYKEPFYVADEITGKYTHCNICWKKGGNLVACKKCTVAMFCVGSCENHYLHQFECGIKDCAIVTDSDWINLLIPVVRSVMNAYHIFGNVDDLIGFVEKMQQTSKNDLPKGVDAKANYAQFLKLEFKNFAFRTGEIYLFHRMMMDQPRIAAIFDKLKYQRFLQHLIADHFLILRDYVRYRKNFAKGGLCYSAQLTLWSENIFEHSCSPNVAVASENGFSNGFAVRPIKKGEPLCRDLYDSLSISPYTKRRDYFMAHHQMKCKCKQCIMCADIDSFPVLTLDPDFQYISIHSEFTPPNFFGLINKTDVKAIQEKAKAFLVKYGRGAWCQELVRIIQLFAAIIHPITNSNMVLYEDPNWLNDESEEEEDES